MDIQNSSLQVSDDAAAANPNPGERVTLKQLHDKISSVEYIYPKSAPTLTIAIVILDNGYSVLGESACADPKKFNKELGQKFALESAVRKIWPLEGYVLRERLNQEGKV